MILFKPRLDVDFEKSTANKFGRCILAETITDGTKIVLVKIYAPNDATQQVVFLRDVSKEFLIPYANDNLVLGGDFNCTISTLDKKGGRPIDSKKASLNELQSLIKHTIYLIPGVSRIQINLALNGLTVNEKTV